MWIYKGFKAPILLQFYGGFLQKEMVLSLKSTYRTNDLNKFHHESDVYKQIMDSEVRVGLAKEIRSKAVLNQMDSMEAKRRRAFLTYAESRAMETCVHKDVKSKDILQEVLEFENPPGYKRHMSMITGSMYNEDKVIEKFITENKDKTILKKIGILPNGFYFLENMSSRLFIKDGKVACLDFMIEQDRELGENRILVPVLHREKIHREGDLNILMNSFKAPEK